MRRVGLSVTQWTCAEGLLLLSQRLALRSRVEELRVLGLLLLRLLDLGTAAWIDFEIRISAGGVTPRLMVSERQFEEGSLSGGIDGQLRQLRG